MKKSDFLVLLGTVIISILLVVVFNIAKEEPKKVVIYVNGEVYGEEFLDKDTEININDGNILKIENNEAFMIYADCPDKLCINQGKIKDTVKSIICLPNKVAVKIEE